LRAIELVSVLFIVLISCSCTTEQVVSQYTLPNRDRTIQYVTGLIGRYNELVSFYYGSRPDFNSIKKLLWLYHDPHNYFQVIVMQSEPQNASYVVLVFVPTTGGQLDLILDQNDTFSGLVQNMANVTGERNILRNNTFTLSNGMTVYNAFAFEILSLDISFNATLNGEDAGQFIFNRNSQSVPKTIAETNSSQTNAQTINQTETTTQDEFSWFNDNPYIKTIVTIGSIITFAAFVAGLMKRKKGNEPKK